MDKFSCERERQRLAALRLHEDGIKSDFHHEMIEEESRAFQQPIDKTIEAHQSV
ncbi:unnamed protein product [Arabidopsis lyrata]|nr:unnamed protein product [Arabidopsis lyrata]